MGWFAAGAGGGWRAPRQVARGRRPVPTLRHRACYFCRNVHPNPAPCPPEPTCSLPKPKPIPPKKSSTNANGFTNYFDLDSLLTEEHLLICQSIRDFVKKEISLNIGQWAQDAHFPSEIVQKVGDVGALGPTIPQEYDGGGLNYISYGLIMPEIERIDSGMRSTTSVQGSPVMPRMHWPNTRVAGETGTGARRGCRSAYPFTRQPPAASSLVCRNRTLVSVAGSPSSA